MANILQIYLAVFMEVVSFPEKIQKEIVPFVRTVQPFVAISDSNSALDSLLGPYFLRRIPSL